MLIQRNISAPSSLLDFPTLETFERELTTHHYDVVGISAIIPNFGKVREMCRRARRLSPQSVIVIGGHVAGIHGIEYMIAAHHIVRGEGVVWMRRYLGEDVDAPLYTRRSCRALAFASWACAYPTIRATPRPRLFRRPVG
jgi:hypothetical protein